MWPVVQIDELLPPVYKNGHGRPRKVRIREYGKDDARRRRPGIAYNHIKCDKFRHNDFSCKSLTQDPKCFEKKGNINFICMHYGVLNVTKILFVCIMLF